MEASSNGHENEAQARTGQAWVAALAEALWTTGKFIAVMLSPEGTIVRINRYLAQLSGWSPEEVEGRDWFETFLPPKERTRVRGVFERAKGSSRTEGYVNPILTRNGEERLVEWYDTHLCDADGALVGILAIGHDVTERESAEALRLANERLRKIFDGIPFFLGLLSPEGRLLEVNAAPLRLRGTSREEIIGAHLWEVEAIRAIPQAEELMREVVSRVAQGETVRFDLRLDLSGRELVIDLMFSPIKDAAGSVVQVVASASDITARTKMEGEVRALNEQLERRVEQRTAEVISAQKELVKHERLAVLGQLTATVSHELRNPLAALRISVQGLAGRLRVLDPSLMGAIARIERTISRCDRLVDELLDFARATNLEPRPVLLDEWLEGLGLSRLCPPGIRLSLEPGCPGVSVLLDVERLQRALVNLVENARQAIQGINEQATGSIRVSTRCTNTEVELQVADSGPGFPPEVRERAFEPLFSTKGFGVGLGLPIVKRVVELHGGSVVIANAPDQGALISIRLPRKAS